MDKKYYLYGASGHSRVVLDVIASHPNFEINAVIDDYSKEDHINSVPVLIPAEVSFGPEAVFLISIGNNWIRKKVVEKNNYSYFKAVHQEAFVSQNVIIDEGSVVMPKAVINANAIVGKHCIINSGSIVEHECVLGDFVHVSPNASLAGNVIIGEGTHIGIGAVVIQGITIGKWVTIGAGAVIIRDVPDYAVVVGNPGKIIKINSDAF
jgi:sugar O-acyltransferase (sialic acid O-acetyltransferase NeuD family)